MSRNRLYILMATLGVILSLAACTPEPTPVQEPRPTPVEEATPTPQDEEIVHPIPERVAVGVAGEGEAEPNDTFEEATLIEAGISQGILGPGDKDYYQFEVPNGGIVKVEFVGAEFIFTIKLFDPTQRKIEEHNFIDEATAILLMNSSSGGACYLAVETPLDLDEELGYTVELTLTMQDDAGTGGDAGDSFEEAMLVEEGKHDGQMGNIDQADYYSFEATSDTVLEFYVDIDASCCIEIVVFDADQKTASRKILAFPGESETFDFSEREWTPGLYFLRILAEEKAGGKYIVELR